MRRRDNRFHNSEKSEKDRLGALVRGPQSVYVYWKLEGRRSRQITEELGPDCEWFLRVLDLTEGASQAMPIDPKARNYYVEVIPGRTYGFELAARAAGKWRPACRTGRLCVPAGGAPQEAPGSVAARGRMRSEADEPHVPGLRYETTMPYLATSPGVSPADQED
ncbi:MAG: DUF4912 domain-containing protein [Planctomycetes bacterium]|nr:DUF4912 domain-containing protein [Planctomycetota bacterium]